MMATGFFNGVTAGRVTGWAKNPGDKNPIPVSLVIDGQTVETKIANLPQPQLSGLIGSIEHGFAFDIPVAYHDGQTHTAGIFVYGSQTPLQPLDEAEGQFRLGIGEADKEIFRQRVKALTFGSSKMKGDALGRGPVALYACHNSTGELSWSQRRMLEELAEAGYRTILCNSTLGGMYTLAAQAAEYCSDLLFRNNFGRDFASWSILIAQYEEEIRASDHVLFVNDSFLGPFGSMEPFFSAYRNSPADFFGLTESWDIEHHFQSSIFILSNAAIASKYFDDLIFGYDFPEDKFKVISRGEIRLSSIFLASGMSSAVFAPYPELCGLWLSRLEDMIQANLDLPEHQISPNAPSQELTFNRPHRRFDDFAKTWILDTSSDLRRMHPVNPQHVFWKELMRDFGIPLIKKELVFSNPVAVPDVWSVSRVVMELYGPEAWQGLCSDARLARSVLPPPPRMPTQDCMTPACPASHRNAW